MCQRFSLAFFVLLLSAFSADGGVIKGVVRDSSSNEAISGVVIGIPSLGIGAQSDIDGLFEITNVPAGKHDVVFNYITFNKVTKTVTIGADETVELNITLKPEKSQLKEVTVKGNKVTNTENAVMMEVRKSNLTVSAVGSAQIAKTMDRNAADVVKRIPGVTIIDDRFVVVRGLHDRYNTTWLNDAGAPSAEVDKKSFSYDIIPSGQIDRVLLFKTPAPELPGDFAGGMIKLYTTSLPDKNGITVGFQTSYREGSTGTPFNYNPKGTTDWLGYDDGHRSLPAGSADRLSKTDQNSEQVTKSFNNNWRINQKNAPVDTRFNIALTNAIHGKNIRFGNLLGLSHSNTYTNFDITRKDIADTSAQGQRLFYLDKEATNKTTVNIMENAAISMGRTKLELRNIYNQSGKAFTIVRRSQPFEQAQADELAYIMGYESLATYAGQLSGTHTSSDENRKYTWTLGYTDLFRNNPDLMRIRYTKPMGTDDSNYMANITAVVDPINGGGRFYSTLSENSYIFNHNISQKIELWKRVFEINIGSYVEYKDRSFSARLLGYTINPGASAFALKKKPINEIFEDENIGDKAQFMIDEATTASDSYTGQNKLIANYVSLTLPVTSQFKVVGGVRHELNTQSLHGFNNTTPVSQDIETSFLLPSVNMSYNLTEKSLLRAAYGKTLNRPEFRELAPFYFYDNENNAGIYGSLYQSLFNPKGKNLEVAEIQNFDLRYEFYPSSGEMIQIGGFYKTFANPIQRVIIPGGDVTDFTFVNCEKAYTYGAEIDVRKNLEFADRLFHTNIFKDFTVVANGALIKSELSFGDSTFDGQYSDMPNAPLQAQSPYIANAGLYYQNDNIGLRGSFLYNVFGPRIYSYGLGGQIPHLWERSLNTSDVNIEKTFFKHYILNLGVQNLFDARYATTYDLNGDHKINGNEPSSNWKDLRRGRYYTIGVKIRF